jgi:hypothetical protein
MNGMERFEVYLEQLEKHLSAAAAEVNPAEWMYANNSRTPLFMLEGLAKLYACMHNKSLFTKLKAHFKRLEDVLGDIDYYDLYVKQFSGNAAIPQGLTDYLEKKKQDNIQLLNAELIEYKWIGKKANRIKKIRKKLKGAGWMKEKEEIRLIGDLYKASVAEINAFYSSAKGQFSDLEYQVHALRRKLRWLSIYPQALQGCIQLTDNRPADEKINKYLVPEILGSSFTKMPVPKTQQHFLWLEKNYFLALSWMIAELGKLKDSGLAVIAINEAMAFKDQNDPAEANTFYRALLPEDTLEGILLKATTICKDYFDEKNLEKMISPAKVSK